MDAQTFVRRYAVDRRHTNCVKWDMLDETFGDFDLLPLWVADMEFAAPEAVIEALRARIDHGAFGYTYVPDDYYEAFFHWMDVRHGYRPEKEQVRFTSGVVDGLYRLVNAFTEPGDAVAVLNPVYYPFHHAVEETGRRLVTGRLHHDQGRFSIDFEDLETKLAEHEVKMLIHCSPHNPVGRVWLRDELERLFALCAEHDVLIVSDEIHQDFVMPGHRHIPAPLVGDGRYNNRLFVLNAASKTFNLAAMAHSHLIIPNETLRERYDAYARRYNHVSFNMLGALATAAAYRGGETWLDGLLQVIVRNERLLRDKVKQGLPGAILSPLEGTYLAFLDLRAVVPPEETETFVQGACRLAVDYGEWFGPDYRGFIRLNLATDPRYVAEAADRLVAEAARR